MMNCPIHDKEMIISTVKVFPFVDNFFPANQHIGADGQLYFSIIKTGHETIEEITLKCPYGCSFKYKEIR